MDIGNWREIRQNVWGYYEPVGHPIPGGSSFTYSGDHIYIDEDFSGKKTFFILKYHEVETDPSDDEEISTHRSYSAAYNAAKRYMIRNPKGIPT